FASITPQVRLSYERQNLENNGTSVALLNAPFTAAGGNQSPGQDYLAAGAGVNFAFNDQLSVLLSYQGQFFRSDMSAHMGALRLSYKF
ncbi:MAG: autotransporter domain-containing protein, partial [Verrucomicrobiaceae bacterium]|nr:autotransporter domain-containing protein [Verrucomicrobiaceae bacterium]